MKFAAVAALALASRVAAEQDRIWMAEVGTATFYAVLNHHRSEALLAFLDFLTRALLFLCNVETCERPSLCSRYVS